ncbi:hypothetical protein BC939DRAFT_312496 [Gamsiella multidivaricata]|uniref:uncharacterized protein n=1 Tax=Gamsiella multidivaricata TaxID=101098 RepID=UPI00221F6F9D|nr:uncharacterized protein BC939DRAFT_312496 [Gamsiella multidivaricata]KAI7817834.1 hypothetical protein BC939DRAFT_312496 [Gamsiella multidivaricata]
MSLHLQKYPVYGFHKIYRYDREESTMNRRNPETQRWQFYHPDFQRDRPHLRNNIKRKSARSANIAPTFSRVVFERDKGFYVQQEAPARPFNVQGGHSRSHSSSHSLDQHRHGHLHGAPPPGPPHYAPHPSPMHRSPHETSQRLPASRSAPDYRPPPGHYPNENVHSRDEKDMVTSKHHVPPPHQQQPIREHDPHHHQNYPGPHYNQQQQQQQQQPPYGSPHQRQRSYVGQPSQAHYSPEHGYSLKAQGFSPIHPPPQDPHHSSMPLSHPTGPGRPGHGSNRDPGNPEHGHDKHGALMSGGHFRSQSAPGMDPRREIPRGPHPFSQQEPRSPLHLSPHPYYQREPYPPHGHPSHRQQGSFDESAAKVPPGPEAGPVVGEGSSPSHRGSLPKHPLSPMGHSQSHLGGVGHPPPSQVQHPYTDQHRRSYVGGPGEQDDPKRRFSPPTPGASFRPAQQRHAMVPPSPSHQQHPPLESGLPGEILPTTPGMDPNANPGPHDLIPRTTKQLESRLQFVEDAYMSLRQAVLDLEGIQATQEQTIAWMRDRIDQLTEASTPRGMRLTKEKTGFRG